MSAIAQQPVPPSSGPASSFIWRQADHDVFVAARDGAYAGHITADADVYTVYDHVGARCGVAGDVSAARALLEAAAAQHAPADVDRSAHASRRRRRRSPMRRIDPRTRAV